MLIKNQLDALISQIYFGMKLYMFRTVPMSIIRSYSLCTQQCYVYVIQVCRLLSSRIVLILLLGSCLQTCMTYTIAVCTVNNSCDGQRNCLKHVEFHF
jgi:hypothetical protein